MSVALFISETAEEQITKAKAWYEARSHGLGILFEHELDRSFSAIRTFPKGATLIRGKLRQMPMSRFPYVILFHSTTTRIVILRVVHGRRHPRHRRGNKR